MGKGPRKSTSPLGGASLRRVRAVCGLAVAAVASQLLLAGPSALAAGPRKEPPPLSLDANACNLDFGRLVRSANRASTEDARDRRIRRGATAVAVAGHVAAGAALMPALTTAPRVPAKVDTGGNAAGRSRGETFDRLSQLAGAPTQPKDRLKTDAELIADAEAGLKRWRETGAVGSGLGEFLVHSEVRTAAAADPGAAQSLEDALAEMRGDLATTRKLAAEDMPGTIADRLQQHFLKTRMKSYCEERALVTDFYSYACANCDGQTRLMLSQLTEIERQLPPGGKLGAQLFGDHIQPVIYFPGTNGVKVLVNGALEKGVRAPIYSPALFYHAFLEDHGRRPAVPLESLLIRDADPGLVAATKDSGVRTNSNMHYRGGRGSAGVGANPAFGVIGQSDGLGGRAGAGGQGGAPARPPYAYTARLMEAKDKKPGGGDPDFRALLRLSEREVELSFRSAADLAKWQTLKTSAERDGFLEYLENRRLAQIAAQPAFRALRNLVKDPGSMASLSPEEISKIRTELQNADLSLGSMYSHRQLVHNTFAEASQLPFPNPVWLSPQLQPIRDGLTRLRKLAEAHPADLLVAIDRLDPKRRVEFLRLFATQNFNLGVSPATLLTPLIQHALDPSKTSVDYPSDALTGRETIIDFQVENGRLVSGTYYPGVANGSPTGSENAPASTTATGEKTKDPKEPSASAPAPRSQPNAPLRLSPLTQAGLLVAGGARYAADNRSDDEASKAPKDGETADLPSKSSGPDRLYARNLYDAWDPRLTAQIDKHFKDTELDEKAAELLGGLPRFLSRNLNRGQSPYTEKDFETYRVETDPMAPPKLSFMDIDVPDDPIGERGAVTKDLEGVYRRHVERDPGRHIEFAPFTAEQLNVKVPVKSAGSKDVNLPPLSVTADRAGKTKGAAPAKNKAPSKKWKEPGDSGKASSQ